jgi:hypothetical protein
VFEEVEDAGLLAWSLELAVWCDAVSLLLEWDFLAWKEWDLVCLEELGGWLAIGVSERGEEEMAVGGREGRDTSWRSVVRRILSWKPSLKIYVYIDIIMNTEGMVTAM